MTVYEHDNYREALKWAAERWKQGAPGRTYSRLSKAAGIHAPYFSNVLKERAHLNADQLFLALQYMGHSNEEMQFLLLLMEEDRCVLQERKKALRKELQQMRKHQGKTENSLDVEVITPTDDYLSRFYLDTTIRLVNAFMGIPEFADNPEKIATSLNLNIKSVQTAIVYLLDVGLVEKDNVGKLKKTKTRIHLPKESHLLESQHKLIRYRCLDHQDRTRDESDYNFGVTFTATAETKELIKKKFMEFLSEVQPLVDEADSEEVFQMNFDLFNWSAEND